MSRSDSEHMRRGKGAGLDQLPELSPNDDAWPLIRARMTAPSTATATAHWKRASLALAASLLVCVPLILILASRTGEQDQQLNQWIRYSQQLEIQLQLLQQQDPVLRGHQAVALDQLESMLAAIDLQLARPERSERQLQLWQQRAVLLNDLVTIQAGASLAANDSPQPVITLNRPPGSSPANLEL